jgi:hypothetical protein
VIENVGTKPITMTALDTLTATETELRPAASRVPVPGSTWQSGAMPLPQQTFKQGDGVIVPMRVEFHSTSPYPGGVLPPGSGQETFKAVSELPPGVKLRVPGSNFAKPASSLGPPTDLPQTRRYVFGPEMVLKAAQVETQHVALRQLDPTAISMFVGYEIGSCPYVFGYDRDAGEWQLQSRAIEGATDRKLAYEDILALENFDGRLKLAELEPEVSFIDDISVEVTLRDGSVIVLQPDDPLLESRDSSYFVLSYPDETEISFPGFHKIRKPIASVKARVFGYYREFGVPSGLVSSRAQGPMCRPRFPAL